MRGKRPLDAGHGLWPWALGLRQAQAKVPSEVEGLARGRRRSPLVWPLLLSLLLVCPAAWSTPADETEPSSNNADTGSGEAASSPDPASNDAGRNAAGKRRGRGGFFGGGQKAPPPPTPCERAQQGAYEDTKRRIANEFQFIRFPEQQRFTFRFPGGTTFDNCSEFFHFLIVEGFFPFHEEWIVKQCLGHYGELLQTSDQATCPNYEAILNEVRRSCTENIPIRMRVVNETHREEILGWYRNCSPFFKEVELPPQITGGKAGGGMGETSQPAGPGPEGGPPSPPQEPPPPTVNDPVLKDTAVKVTPCDLIHWELVTSLKHMIESQVGLVDLGEWEEPRYMIQLLGMSQFSPCSEFFNFLVTEGAFPFDEDKAVETCVTLIRQSAYQAGATPDCPNWDSMQETIRTKCETVMRRQIREINARKEELLKIHRKCQEDVIRRYEDKHGTPAWDNWDWLPPFVPDAPAAPESTPKDAIPDATGKTPDVVKEPVQPQPQPPSPEPPPQAPPPETGPLSTPAKDDSLPQPPQVVDDVTLPQRPSCCERCPHQSSHERYYNYSASGATPTCNPGDAVIMEAEDGECWNTDPVPWVYSTYGLACCAGKKDQLLYDSAKSGNVNSEVGSALRAACEEDPCAGRVDSSSGAPMRLETSILSTGSGAQGRNWVPENATLKVGKDQLKPCHTEPFYVAKESTTHAAAVVLTAISADYADDADTAQASKGSSCHASEGGGSAKRDSPQERAVKATALGLLASQAKGQIEGLRATFDVTGHEQQLEGAKLQADIVNEVTQQKQRLNIPVKFEVPDAVSGQ